MLALPYDKTGAVGATFNADHDGSFQLDLELAVKGAFDYDPHKCHVVFKLDDQELVNRDFAWYDNKDFPFLSDQKLSAGAHRLTCELRPFNADLGHQLAVPADYLRDDSWSVGEGILDTPEKLRPLFHEGRTHPPIRSATICGGTPAQLRLQGLSPSGG